MAIIILLSLLAIFLTGCTNEVEYIPDMEISTLERNILAFERNQAFEDIGIAMSCFSQNLFREILVSGKENAVISPLSVYYVLAMVALGANEDTLYEFQAILGKAPQDLALKLASIAQSLLNIEGSTKLNLAGSIWICDEFMIKPEFNHNVIYFFNAYVRSRNFLCNDTIGEINHWIYSQTKGLLYEVIEKIDEDAIMLLINTLYLSAKWASSFNPMNANINTFFLECGNKIETTFLSTNHFITLAISVTDYYEAVLLPYDDDRLGFFAVRPTDGTYIRDFVSTHDLMSIVNGLYIHHEVLVCIPKLDKEFDIGMNDSLQKLGLISAFDGRLANLQGLVEGYDPVYIYEVRQKVRITVNTEGTEAAAATIVTPSAETSLLQPIELNFNTPYVYIIFDNKTGAILFMGIVDNPSS